MKGRPSPLRQKPFFFYLMAFTSLIIIAVLGTMVVYDNYKANAAFSAKNLKMQEMTEQSLENTLKLTYTGTDYLEEPLNRQMEAAFIPFIHEYNRSGGDPRKMDLAALKNGTSDPFEYFVINRDATVVATTYSRDQNLSFSQAPYFVAYLDLIRQKGGFYPDPIIHRAATGETRKYSYQASPDHAYVLELGWNGSVGWSPGDQQEYHDRVARIVAMNPYITSYRFFDTLGRPGGTDTGSIPDSTDQEAVKTAVSSRKTVVVSDPANGTEHRYLFIDLRGPDSSFDVSTVARLTYDTAKIAREKQSALNEHLLFLAVMVLLGLLAAALFSRFITRPIERIAHDVDLIAHGDLDHRIKRTIGSEFAVLEESINQLVERLRTMIGDLRQGREQLAVSEERYRKTLGIVSDYAYSIRIGPEGEKELEWSSNLGRNITGYEASELDFSRLPLLMHPADRQKIAAFYESLSGCMPHSDEFRIIRKDGEVRWLLHHTVPECDPEGRLIRYYSAGLDITDRKQAQEDLIRLQLALEEKVRERTADLESSNRDLESFTYSVSHDLRAPIRAIDGFAGIFMEECGEALTPDCRSYIARVRENARKMGVLIDDLLSFSRLGRVPLGRLNVDIRAVATEVIGEGRLQEKGRDITITMDDLPPCSADPSLLRVVLANLIGNAIKYTRNVPHAVIRLGYHEEDGEVAYYVRDNGIGFDMKYAHRIFSVFQRLHADEEYEGTGVGLAIVKRIIDRHGGRIWAEARPGEGATFWFTLGPYQQERKKNGEDAP